MLAGVASSHVQETPGLQLEFYAIIILQGFLMHFLDFEPLFAKVSKSCYEEHIF